MEPCQRKATLVLHQSCEADEKARDTWNSPLFNHLWEATLAIEITPRAEGKGSWNTDNGATILWDHIQFAFILRKRGGV